MSITAEKIMVALQNVNERNGGAPYEAINKWQREVLSEQADAILSLLQQGEPEGWKLVRRELTGEQMAAAASVLVEEYNLAAPDDCDRLQEMWEAMLSASPLPPAPGAETAEQEQDRFDADADSISSEVNHLPEVQSLPDLCSEDVWPHVERALVAVGRHFRRSKSNG